jgi:predicted ATPase
MAHSVENLICSLSRDTMRFALYTMLFLSNSQPPVTGLLAEPLNLEH